MNKILFLKSNGKKKDVIKEWYSGKAFFSEDNDLVVSKKSVDNIRDRYTRIIILYDNGTLEV